MQALPMDVSARKSVSTKKFDAHQELAVATTALLPGEGASTVHSLEAHTKPKLTEVLQTCKETSNVPSKRASSNRSQEHQQLTATLAAGR
ncbi:hypothetical protein PI126_g19490 [Phytophthora idaei]|nr:hypothetical protein PI126_g19490 [Phytophthora idaei]